MNRLLALHKYNILDTPQEKDLNDVVCVAAQVCDTPIALISLTDSNRQWFKSKIGLNISEIPREGAFCDHAVRGQKTFIIEDTHSDIRFVDHPLVTASPHFRFYAGALLTTSDGYNIGTLCVIDTKPSKIQQGQIESLEALARQVINLFEFKKQIQKIQQEAEAQSSKISQTSRLTALGEMAGGIAHEINNPLAVIKASSQLLEIELKKDYADINPKIFKSLKRIDTTVDRISKIVKGLRSFARDGKSDPMQPVSLGQLVSEAFDLSQTRFKSHGIQVDFPENLEDCYVQGRPVELVQVILNILNNAHDAVLESDEKFVHVRLETDSSSVFLIIEDSGPGIPVGIINRVMDPFFTTKPIGQGTGLGLSISKEILEFHNGEINYARVNNRTQFKIRLPLSKLQQKAI